jgi:hypothetical protein
MCLMISPQGDFYGPNCLNICDYFKQVFDERLHTEASPEGIHPDIVTMIFQQFCNLRMLQHSYTTSTLLHIVHISVNYYCILYIFIHVKAMIIMFEFLYEYQQNCQTDKGDRTGCYTDVSETNFYHELSFLLCFTYTSVNVSNWQIYSTCNQSFSWITQ